jgi:hypothetical protein
MRLLLATLLSANAAAGSLAIAATKSAFEKGIEKRAERVFKDSDSDQDGVLSATEQNDAHDAAEKAIKKFLDDNKHHPPLPEVPAPKLADGNAMTATEFVQYFKSLAGRKDASNRAKKKKPGGVSGASPASGGPWIDKKPDPREDEKPRKRPRIENPGAPPPNPGGAAPNPTGGVPPPRAPTIGGPRPEPTVVREQPQKNPSEGHKGGKDERPKNMPEKPKHEPPGNGGKHQGGKLSLQCPSAGRGFQSVMTGRPAC